MSRAQLLKKGFILHQDNAPAHIALSVKNFLAEKQILIHDHLPYTPDLAPCDFFLFPKIKAVHKGTKFDSVQQVMENPTQLHDILRKIFYTALTSRKS